MVRMRRWRNAAMALVLSLVLVMSVTHLTVAKSSSMQQTQRPQVECSANVSVPQLGEGQRVLTTGSINCPSTVFRLDAITHLEMKKGDSWVSINFSSSGPSSTSNLSVTASADCSSQQKVTYRGVAFGSYEDESGKYRAIPQVVSPEVSLKCE